MRLFAATLALAAVAQASGSKADQDLVSMIESDLETVARLTNNVTIALSMVDANNISTALPITQLNTNLVGYIQNITKKIADNTAMITNSESQGLGAYTQELAYTVNHSIAELISKKPAFEQLKLTGIVVNSLQTQANASDTLSATILKKISAQLAPVAGAISDQISESLQMGLNCFQGMNSSCNPTPVNASRTLDAAIDTGAISGGSMLSIGGWTVVLGAVAVALATGL